MNLRAIIAALYTIVFLITLLNIMTVPSSMFAEAFPMLYTSIILALAGVLLALWVYQDAENIKILDKEVIELENRIKELEKSE